MPVTYPISTGTDLPTTAYGLKTLIFSPCNYLQNGPEWKNGRILNRFGDQATNETTHVGNDAMELRIAQDIH